MYLYYYERSGLLFSRAIQYLHSTRAELINILTGLMITTNLYLLTDQRRYFPSKFLTGVSKRKIKV